MWSVVGGFCTLVALVVTLVSLWPHRTSSGTNDGLGGGPLDVHGTWDGQLVGSTGTLIYHLTLSQNGSTVTGQARGEDSASGSFVVFSLVGQVDQQGFSFEETGIIDANPSTPGSWCMVSASLHPAGNGTLAGGWNASVHNPDLNSCGGVNGNLTIHR
jgi:hypothetical protein